MFAFASVSQAVTITNPGANTLEITGGFLKVGTEIDQSLSDLDENPTLVGSVDSQGNILIPKSAFNFGELQFPVETDVPLLGHISGVIGIEITANQDVTGTVDPISGLGTLNVNLNIRAYRLSGDSLLDVGNNCRINPVQLTMRTDTSAYSGSPNSQGGRAYSVADGTARFADKTFSVPGQSGCSGLAAGQINGLLGIPSGAGANGAEFDAQFNPAPISNATINIGAKPANPTNQTTANFTYTTSVPSGLTHQCKLDAGSWTTCPPGQPVTLTGLGNGSHTFTVRATAGGNDVTAPGSNNSYTWTVDTVPPVLGINGAPTGLTKVNSATLSLTSSKTLSVRNCTLDGNPFSPCNPGTPVNLSSLSDGDHTFVFQGTDGVGNQGSVSKTWRVDATKPVVTFNSTPPAVASVLDWDFQFTATDNDQLAPNPTQCRLWETNDPADPNYDPQTDQLHQDWATCSSPDNQTLENGYWRYEVRATDKAGNVSNITAYSWRINSTQPIIDWLEGPAGTRSANTGASADGDAIFQFSAAESDGTPDPAATFECSLNGSTPAPCTSPVEYEVGDLNPEGQENTFTVKPISSGSPPVAGAVTPYRWTFDATAPDLTVSSAPQQPNSPASVATFQYAADGTGSLATVQCNLDGAGFVPCDSNTSQSDTLADGTHQMKLRAVDQAGNTSAITTHDWVIDTQVPLAQITGHPLVIDSRSSADFAFTVSDNRAGLQTECSLDNVAFTACDSHAAHHLAGLNDGDHTLEVKVTDLAGNTVTRSYDWMSDTANPVVNLMQGPDSPTRTQTASFRFNQSDATAGIDTTECRIDASAWEDCTPSAQGWVHYTGPYQHGSHKFTVRVTDRAGNFTEKSQSWVVDRSKPQVGISTQMLDTENRTAEIAFVSDRAGATFECKLDAGAWGSCTSPASLADLSVGNHVFTVRATAAIAGESVVGDESSTAWQVQAPPPETCPDGQTGTPPNCVTPPPDKCADGQVGTPPNCKTPLPPIKKPTGGTGTYDPATGKLAIRLMCPHAMKPKCQGTAVAVTAKGKRAKVMSSKVRSTSKAGKWKRVTITIKPAYRDKVALMSTVNKKKLIIRQTVKSKRHKKKKNVFHTYKVRVKG